MTRRAILALAAPLALCAGVASAATFDFGALAEDAQTEAGRELQWAEHFGPGGAWTVDGVTVLANDNAHLDASFRSGLFESAAAGLGLCNSPSGDCNASDWDGIRDAGETLTLAFSRAVAPIWTLRETTAAWREGRAPDHTLMEGCARVNGVEHGLTGGILSGLGASTTWTFEPCAGSGSDFYVTAAEIETPPAPVPVPAGAVLLGSALAALGLRARRKAR